MIKTLSGKNLHWFHVPQISADDIVSLEKALGLKRLEGRSLGAPIQRPRVHVFPEYTEIVTRWPIFSPEDRQIHAAEVVFILSKHAIATVVFGRINSLDQLFDTKGQAIVDDSTLRPGDAFVVLFQNLLDHIPAMVDHLVTDVENIEKMLFKNNESSLIIELARLQKNCVDFKKHLAPLKGSLLSMQKKSSLFDSETGLLIDLIIDEIEHLLETIDTQANVLYIVREANASVATLALNREISILTILNTMLTVLVIGSALAVEFPELIPFHGHPFGLWINIAVLFAIVGGVLFFLKKKRYI